MPIRVIHTLDRAENIMQQDQLLLDQMHEQDQPILHLYQWKNPSITYGHFIPVEKIIDLEKAQLKFGIDIARRPTGGGIIFHLFDYAFSFFLPSGNRMFSHHPIDNYAFVHQIVKKALLDLIEEKDMDLLYQNPEDSSSSRFFCMAKPTIYDLMVGSKKLAGAAQRKKKQGYLHQGSIALVEPNLKLVSEILKQPDPVDKMKALSFYFLPSSASIEEIENQKLKIEARLIQAFKEEIRL